MALSLDAVQGNIEARTEPYMKYGEGALEIFDTVMRQEHLQSSGSARSRQMRRTVMEDICAE